MHESMETGYLSHYFKAVASKRLTAVEVDRGRSNQHEFNGVSNLRELFGSALGKTCITARFLYLSDDEDTSGTSAEGTLTWYDARENHPTRSERRLYYRRNDVTDRMLVGDSFFVAILHDNSAIAVVAQKDSVIEKQLYWLFGLSPSEEVFSLQDSDMLDKTSLIYLSRQILDELGIELVDYTQNLLVDLKRVFGHTWPSTKDFSAFTRDTLPEELFLENADEIIVTCMDREELLFRTYEKHLLAERLQTGFKMADEADVEGFIGYALSVLNRRKSRAGQALENHVEHILLTRGVPFTRQANTEGKKRADFIFPSQERYHDLLFPSSDLHMLACKRTLKDRWRQVLSEAARIDRKHLLTLQAPVSVDQTNEMQSSGLQLVVPTSLQALYTRGQRDWLIGLEDFIACVLVKP